MSAKLEPGVITESPSRENKNNISEVDKGREIKLPGKGSERPQKKERLPGAEENIPGKSK